MLVLNLSSVAVLWFGGHRIASGGMQIGALTAFLSLPAADPDVGDDGDVHVHDGAAGRGLRRADQGGARHRVRACVPPGQPGRRAAPATASWSCATSSSATRAPRQPVLQRHRPGRPARRDDRDHRRHRQRQDHAAQPDPAAVRRDRRRGAGRRRRRARARPGAAGRRRSGWCRRSRTCSPAPSRRTCATASPTPPTRSCGTRWRSRRPRDFVEQMHGRPGRADRAGRHQRVRRPAAAAGDRPGAGAPAGDLPVRRLVLRARLRHRRARCARRWRRETADATVVIVAQRVSHDPATPTGSSCSTRAGSSAPAPTPS